MIPSPAQSLGRYFRAVGVSPAVTTQDWYSYVGGIPGSTSQARDNIIVISDSAPVPDGRDFRTTDFIRHPGVQVLVRAKAYDIGWDKAKTVLTKLEAIKMTIVTVDTKQVRLDAFNLTGGPMFVGQEENNLRQHFSINGTLTFKEL